MCVSASVPVPLRVRVPPSTPLLLSRFRTPARSSLSLRPSVRAAAASSLPSSLQCPQVRSTPGHRLATFVRYHVSWALIMTALIGQMLYLHVPEACCSCLSFPHHPPRNSFPSPLGLMSHTHPTPASSSNFQLIFDDAFKAYEKRTRKDLLTHPLAPQLQRCNSPSSILDILQQQVQELNQSQRRNERWTRWLDPTVNVLHAFSETIAEGATLVCPGS